MHDLQAQLDAITGDDFVELRAELEALKMAYHGNRASYDQLYDKARLAAYAYNLKAREIAAKHNQRPRLTTPAALLR